MAAIFCGWPRRLIFVLLLVARHGAGFYLGFSSSSSQSSSPLPQKRRSTTTTSLGFVKVEIEWKSAFNGLKEAVYRVGDVFQSGNEVEASIKSAKDNVYKIQKLPEDLKGNYFETTRKVLAAREQVAKAPGTVKAKLQETKGDFDETVLKVRAVPAKVRDTVEETALRVKEIPVKVRTSADETIAAYEAATLAVQRFPAQTKAKLESAKKATSDAVDAVKRKPEEIRETFETLAKTADDTAKAVTALPGKVQSAYVDTTTRLVATKDAAVAFPGQVKRTYEDTASAIGAAKDAAVAFPGNVKKTYDDTSRTIVETKEAIEAIPANVRAFSEKVSSTASAIAAAPGNVANAAKTGARAVGAAYSFVSGLFSKKNEKVAAIEEKSAPPPTTTPPPPPAVVTREEPAAVVPKLNKVVPVTKEDKNTETTVSSPPVSVSPPVSASPPVSEPPQKGGMVVAEASGLVDKSTSNLFDVAFSEQPAKEMMKSVDVAYSTSAERLTTPSGVDLDRTKVPLGLEKKDRTKLPLGLEFQRMEKGPPDTGGDFTTTSSTAASIDPSFIPL